MPNPKQRLSAETVAALAAGLLVVAVAALVTTRVRPLAFPLNYFVSLGLGMAAFVGAAKVLDPRTTSDLAEAQAAAEYRSLLNEMKVIAARTWVASQQPGLDRPTAQRLRSISSTVGLLVSRYQAGGAGLASASATLTVLKQFDRVLTGYLKIRSGEQFVDAQARQAEVAETEERTIPMVQAALQMLGQQLDAGRVVDKKVWEGTLASLLRSLDLVDAPNGRAVAGPEEKERPR